MIEEVLDTDFIKQQAENNSLDFHKYAKFVIDLMAKLAAPARDEMIQNISTLTDTVSSFRKTLAWSMQSLTPYIGYFKFFVWEEDNVLCS